MYKTHTSIGIQYCEPLQRPQHYLWEHALYNLKFRAHWSKDHNLNNLKSTLIYDACVIISRMVISQFSNIDTYMYML